MPIESRGSFTPGLATGSHSGYEVGPFNVPDWGDPSGTLGSLLKRQQRMREAQAQAQLDLIAEQIANAQYDRVLKHYMLNQPSEGDKDRDWKTKMYQAEQAAQQERGRVYAKVMTAGQGGNLFQMGVGGAEELGQAMGVDAMMAGSRSAGEQWGRIGADSAGAASGLSAARGKQMLEAGLEPYGPPPPEAIGGDSFVGPTYGPDVNTGLPVTQARPSPGFMGPMPQSGATIPQAPMPPVQPTPPSTRSYYGWEKGSLPGTVPETGPAIIHEGEVVIPDEQVDEPLLEALRRDAIRKGVPLGQKTAGGYAPGSLGEEDPLAFLFGGGGVPQDALQEWTGRYPGATAGTPAMPPPKGLGSLPAVRTSPTGQGAWAGANRPPLPDMPHLSIDYVEEMRRRMDEAMKAASPPDRKLLKAGLRQTVVDTPTGAIDVSDDVAKVLKKTKKGRAFLGLLTLGGSTAGLMAAGAGEEPLSDTWFMNPLEVPARAYTETMNYADEQRAAGEDVGLSELFGRGIHETGKAFGAGVSQTVGPFMRGLFGKGGEEPAEVVTPTEAPAGTTSTEMLQPSEQGGTLEAALARVQEGDFGTPDEPLELTGQRGSYDQGMDELRGLPENISSSHKSKMNQVQVENMLNHLEFHGHEMSDDQKQMMIGLVQEKQKLAGLHAKDVQGREKFMQDQIKQAQAVEQALLRIEMQAQATQNRQLTVEEAKAGNREKLSLLREGGRALREQLKIAVDSDSPRARADAKRYIAMMIDKIAQMRGRKPMGDAEALDAVDELLNVDKEQQEMALSHMEQMLQGMR